MSCPNGYPLYNKNGRFIGMSSCGECPICRLKRSMELTFYSTCQAIDSYKKGRFCKFYTLTYSDGCLPLNRNGVPTVLFSDFQKFKKRFNKSYSKHFTSDKRYKVLGTTEYGDDSNRPHMHFLLYDVPDDYRVEDMIYDAWDYRGNIQSGPLRAGGAYYLSSYCSCMPSREALSKLYDENEIERPVLSHSFNLGGQYLDGIIRKALDNNMCTDINGHPVPLPGYIRRKYDPYGVRFNKMVFLRARERDLQRRGLTELEDMRLKYRSYLDRCHKHHIPVLDDSHKGIFMPLPSVKFDNKAYSKKPFDSWTTTDFMCFASDLYSGCVAPGTNIPNFS
jgi:hypothetical protein